MPKLPHPDWHDLSQLREEGRQCEDKVDEDQYKRCGDSKASPSPTLNDPTSTGQESDQKKTNIFDYWWRVSQFAIFKSTCLDLGCLDAERANIETQVGLGSFLPEACQQKPEVVACDHYSS